MKTTPLSLMTIIVIFSILFTLHNCNPDDDAQQDCNDETVFHPLTKAEKNLFAVQNFDTIFMTRNTDTVLFYNGKKEFMSSVDSREHSNPDCKSYRQEHVYELYHLRFNSTIGSSFLVSVYNQGSFFRVFFGEETYEYPLNLIGNTRSAIVTTYPSLTVNGKEYKNVTAFEGIRDSTNTMFLNREVGLIKLDYPKYNLTLERLE